MTRYNLLTGVLLMGLVASMAVFLVGRLKTIASPFEIVYGEGLLWYQTHMLLNGIPLYQTVTSTQYLIIPHTPLFVIICSWLPGVLGDSMLGGRIITLLCGLGSCLMVYLITKKLTKNPLVSLLAGLLVVTTYIFRFLVPIYRVDTMALMFSLLGIYFFMKFEERGRLVYWTVPLFLLAFFTKQVYIVAPVSVCVYLLIKNHWKFASALKFGGIYLGALGGGLLIGGLLTNWELIIHNFMYMGADIGREWSWAHYLVQLKYLVTWHIPLLLLVLVYFGYKVSRKKPLLLIDIYFIGGLGIVLLLQGKLGGGFHYGFEMLVVGCVLAGILIDRTFGVLKERLPDLKKVGASAVIFTLVGFQIVGIPFGHNFFTYEFLDTNEVGTGQLVSLIQEAEDPVFAYVIANTMNLAGEVDEWVPWEYGLLFVGGYYRDTGRLGWDQSDMVEKLRTGYYGLAVFEYDLEAVWFNDPRVDWVGFCRERLSVEVATALLENFSPVLVTEPVGTNRFPMRHFVYKYDGIGVIDYEKGPRIFYPEGE